MNTAARMAIVRVLEARDLASLDTAVATTARVCFDLMRDYPGAFPRPMVFEEIRASASAANARTVELRDNRRWKAEAREDYLR